MQVMTRLPREKLLSGQLDIMVIGTPWLKYIVYQVVHWNWRWSVSSRWQLDWEAGLTLTLAICSCRFWEPAILDRFGSFVCLANCLTRHRFWLAYTGFNFWTRALPFKPCHSGQQDPELLSSLIDRVQTSPHTCNESPSKVKDVKVCLWLSMITKAQQHEHCTDCSSGSRPRPYCKKCCKDPRNNCADSVVTSSSDICRERSCMNLPRWQALERLRPED